MHYRIVFGDADPDKFGTEEFEAEQLSDALFHVATRYSRQPIELWCEDSFLGRLKHIVDDQASYWRLA